MSELLPGRLAIAALAAEIGVDEHIEVADSLPDLPSHAVLLWAIVHPDAALAMASVFEDVRRTAEVSTLAVEEGALVIAHLLPVPENKPVTVRQERRLSPVPRPTNPKPLERPTRREPSASGRKSLAPQTAEHRLVAGATSADLEQVVEVGTEWLLKRGAIAVPTIAGLIAFGSAPHHFLPGAVVMGSAGQQRRRFVGSVAEIIDGLATWEPLASAGRSLLEALVVHGFTHRDWSADAEALPIELHLEKRRLMLSIPRGEPSPAMRRGLASRGLQEDLHAHRTDRRLQIRNTQLGVTVDLPEVERRLWLPQHQRQDLLLQHLEEHGPSSTTGLVNALGWTRSTTRAIIDSLLEDGRVRGTKAKRQAPGQRYELTSDR